MPHAMEQATPPEFFPGAEPTEEADASPEREAEGPEISAGGGSPLPEPLRAKMELGLGADLSSVQLHTGGASAAAAKGMGARAFTAGSDVHFDAGQYAPGTPQGDKLLAHELTHVVQGGAGVQRK